MTLNFTGPRDKTPTIVAIDDATFVRERFDLGVPGLNCLGTFRNVEQFLASGLRPDVVLLDLNLNGYSGASAGMMTPDVAIRHLSEDGMRVCLYTEQTRKPVLVRCLRAGAQGIVHKEQTTAELVDAVSLVAHGQISISTYLSGLTELLTEKGALPNLTDRQVAIIRGRARGESWKAIAARNYIDIATARDHLDAAHQKVAAYLRTKNPADIERELGLAPGDIFDS